MSSENLLRNGGKHVVIIGAGAAGTSCAVTLAQHPDMFKATMIERMPVTGGQATSIPLEKDKYGAEWLNDGVKGGSPIFPHTLDFFNRYGHDPQEVKLQVSFGNGKDGFWSNVFPGPLVNEFSGDIRKFSRILKLIKWTIASAGIGTNQGDAKNVLLQQGFW